MRKDKRKNNQLRDIEIIPNYNPYAEGSCLIKFGNTHVICTASVEKTVPNWLKGQNKGWITAEYAMLPRSCAQRISRETKQPSGRTQEIQRLVGRSLRAVVDLEKLSGFSVCIDCDVIQADGGTRTASVTGGFVALYLAFRKLIEERKLKTNPINEFVAAVSCAIHDGEAVLDVNYDEDSSAQADVNFVLTETGKIVEVQGTAEDKPFEEFELLELMELAKEGISRLVEIQKKAVGF